MSQGRVATSCSFPGGVMSTEIFVGLDVAKAQLDVAVRPSGERWSVANDESGIAQLVGRLRALRPTLIVAEATGGFERAAIAALAAASLPLGRRQSAPGARLRSRHRPTR